MRKIDLIGRTFGRLTVLTVSDLRRADNRLMWRCRCSCGAEIDVRGDSLRNGNTQSCGCIQREYARQHRGANHKSWKGGRHTTSSGYIRVLMPDGRYRFEHVLVMERHLGRPLTNREEVHHKNGIRNDNTLENLELWSKSHPCGSRVADLVAWAKDILSQYGDVSENPHIA